MLFGQQSGWRQNSHLFATRDSHKRCAQGHFGFAKAYIATHQTVHGARADHVLNDGMNGGILVCGFAKTKVVCKHFVILRAVSERMAFTCSAAGINVQQFCG